MPDNFVKDRPASGGWAMSDAGVVDVPERKDIAPEDCWDLSRLFASEAAWEVAFEEFELSIEKAGRFKGSLGESVDSFLDCLVFDEDRGKALQRLYYYAMLRQTEDGGNSESQGRMSRVQNAAASFQAAFCWFEPELLAIPDATLAGYLVDETVKPFRVYLQKMLRQKPHTLSEAEERLLAMQAEFAGTPDKAFKALSDVDMDFGELETTDPKQKLSHGSYAQAMINPDRAVREEAYTKFMGEFTAHKQTLAALYQGNVQQGVFNARVRKFSSAREASLFEDDVPVSVYDQLIEAVHKNLPVLHRYYALRKKVLKLDELRPFDTRVPMVPEVHTHYPYDQAVDLLTKSLKPLGTEYTDTLQQGLRRGWVDRYENKGKYSGAFSAGSFNGDPYILMNYKEHVLNDLFTLTHEAGHSMHSWYSVRNNPFPHYRYTIFVAEVASTFNEKLLSDYFYRTNDDPQFRAYLINTELDAIIGTIFRQTLFAEFEKKSHAMAENNEPLTVDAVTAMYGELLQKYYGPDMVLDENSAIECYRIPHFYSAFYVYKYATGLSAAIALSRKVIDGEAGALEKYLRFLKSGGSKFPLEQLKDAGIDMTTPDPVNAALSLFSERLTELESLIG